MKQDKHQKLLTKAGFCVCVCELASYMIVTRVAVQGSQNEGIL